MSCTAELFQGIYLEFCCGSGQHAARTRATASAAFLVAELGAVIAPGHVAMNLDFASAFRLVVRKKLDHIARTHYRVNDIPRAVGAIDHASMMIKGVDYGDAPYAKKRKSNGILSSTEGLQ
eukprot:5608497-Pyramimonas_sp.AAC.1